MRKPKTTLVLTGTVVAGVGMTAAITANAASATDTSAVAGMPSTQVNAAAPSEAAIRAAVAEKMQAEAAMRAAVVANWEAQAAAAAAAAAPQVSPEVAAWASSPKSMDVKMCESTHNYSINTGNGYYGAWQFDYPSWHANGGGAYAEFPHLAPDWAQDQVAYNYYQKAGWGPWECG
jgi:hypothetical protein